MGSNLIEFRWARKWTDATKTVQNDLRLQFRTKDLIFSVTGPILSDWSQWYDFDSVPIEDVISP